MTKEEILEMLTATKSPIEISLWLRNTYFPMVTNRFNLEQSRKRFALYQGEKIPTNERNLTDVRTRMGTHIEFELTRLSNEILPEYDITDVFWSYVVANRFPDLEVRRNNGDRLLRLEVKCLQCVAEEKSANFSTILKDIDPVTDYVVVCLWDWDPAGSIQCEWDNAPMIYRVYVFHAYSLALLRDTYWLNNPPDNLGNGFQGFDVRYAITCNNGKYSKEQGNYGKLMRIWYKNFEHRPPTSNVLLDTETEFLKFQEEVVFSGFQILARRHLEQLVGGVIAEIRRAGELIGYKAHHVAYVRSSVVPRGPRLNQFMHDNSVSIIVAMTDKYKCTIYQMSGNDITVHAKDQKPKNVVDIIRQI